MRAWRTTVEAGKSGLRHADGRLALSRFVTAFLSLTLLFMPLAMSGGLAMMYNAPAAEPDMHHCTGEHETSPGKRLCGTIDCATACAVVQPTAPQIMTGFGPARQNVSSQLAPRLEGIVPHATSPPPRLPEV